MSQLTARQEEVLNFIIDEVIKYRRPPTVREIATHFGMSINGAASARDTLERKNVIQIYREQARGIRLIDPPHADLARFTIVTDATGRAVGAFQPLPALYRS